MRTRLLAVLACLAACAGTALVAVPAAHADATLPSPGPYWSECTGPTDKYCVASVVKNGAVIHPDFATGVTPFVETIGSGSVAFGVYDFDADPDSLNIPSGDTYGLVVRTGSIRPRELDGVLRDPTFSSKYVAGRGWEFTVTFRPSSANWVGYSGDTRTCTISACGDDTWHASLTYTGFANGYVTDLSESGLDAAEISQRTGMVTAYNAQDADNFYDPDTNSLVVQLANPHLTKSGALATGTYQAFLPTAFVEGTMNVPDASALSTGTVQVVRTAGGVASSAPFTVTPVAGGIKISITGITYSRPTYTIHPGPSQPRKVSARKISAHKARVRFRAPAKTLGYRINKYQARCQKPGKAWHLAKATGSPITVGNLPKGIAYCQVRAHNKLGWGTWSALRHT